MRVRRWQHRHHISRPDLAFDLIALRRKMRFYRRIEIRLFYRLFSSFSDGSYPFGYSTGAFGQLGHNNFMAF